MLRLALLIPAFALAACTADAPEPGASSTDAATSTDSPIALGDAVPTDAALPADELLANADAYAGQTVTVEGTIREVCQSKGCWLALGDGEGRSARVQVPKGDDGEYRFTFPMDAGGQTVRLVGTFEATTESVELLRHLAEDRGDSPEEVAAITEPRDTYVIEALGAEIVGATDA